MTTKIEREIGAKRREKFQPATADESNRLALTRRPTAETDPSECRWCAEEAFGAGECPYHGEKTQAER